MRVFQNLEELAAATGEELGVSGWHEVTQEQIDAFAAATGDHQWIHVDPARAAAGPFGRTIAHGFLTLALVPMLAREVYELRGVTMGINYGVNRVRFPSPLPTGSRVHGSVRLESAEPIAGGLQVVTHTEVTSDGAAKPCCVADTVARFFA